MPFIVVRMFEGRPTEKKKELGEAITRETCRILGCGPEAVDIIFEDVQRSDWMSAGKLHGGPT
jgi:4-oxalocrotonate tautomerase